MANTKHEARKRRHRRVRGRVHGVATRPRLAVYRSNRTIYAQLIDDDQGRTLAAADSRRLEPGVNKTAAARLVGGQLAERARAAGIERVVFDRGGYLYHGRVKALAEAAREGGLVF
jgi:large subunit ribosomal protein L18